MVDLTDAQWLGLCGWREGLRGAEPLVYTEPCEGWSYDWTREFCATQPGGYHAAWRDVPADCGVTVAQFAGCIVRQAEVVCYVGEGFPAECATLGMACAEGDSADGGLAHDP